MNEKADPFKHKQRWERWKKHQQLESRYGDHTISPANQKLIIEYLLDMEAGYNVSRKGRRSFIRLNTIRQRMTWLLANMGFDDITSISRRDVLTFFNKMESGEIRRNDGKPYRHTIDYIKIFKAFWHWYQRRELEHDRIVKDITIDLDITQKKENTFVYFTIEDFKKVIDHCKYKYRVYLWVLFDSGIRSPTEFMSLRNSDFEWKNDSSLYELDIKEGYSKTFGRKIKLVLSSSSLVDFLQNKQPESGFFDIDWQSFCRYLKRVFVKVLGDKATQGGKPFHDIRPYDIRHCSACYWLPRYKNPNAYLYRFGWKEMSMMHYYTKFLGMNDTISQDDLLIDSEAKTKLEQELDKQRQTRALMEERLVAQEKQIGEMDKKFETINTFMNQLVKNNPNLTHQLARQAKAENIPLPK